MRSEKKHILIVTSEFPPQPGGIGNHAYHLALYLFKQNYLVTVIADQRSKSGKEEIDFDRELPFSIVRIKRHAFRLIMYFNRIITTYKCFGRASNVIATGKFSLWNVALISKFKKVQTLAIVHGSEVNFKSYLLKKSIDKSLLKFDKIVAVSNYTKGLIKHLDKDVAVIPNGINLSEWHITEMSNIELKGKPALTTVGRVSSRKGQLNVIKQLPELIKEFPELHYHCIGIPTEADAFIMEAKRLNAESYITFHGSVDAQTLKQMLNSTDIFIMLSSEDKSGDVEGFGIAILEANALGIPTIGSKGCGIEDAIKPNTSGLLIDLNDTKQLQNSIIKILHDKDIYKRGAKDWAQQHNWSTIIMSYISLLK